MKNCKVLFHKPRIVGPLYDCTLDDLCELNTSLNNSLLSMMKVYKKSGGNKFNQNKFDIIMSNEKYTSLQECVKMGFVDKIL